MRRLNLELGHFPEKIPDGKLMNCIVHMQRHKRARTTWVCTSCMYPMCAEGSFQRFYTQFSLSKTDIPQEFTGTTQDFLSFTQDFLSNLKIFIILIILLYQLYLCSLLISDFFISYIYLITSHNCLFIKL